MIKLQDARIADGLPRVVAEQPWAKVLSAVYGELQGRMLEYLATGMTFSDVDNCSEGMLDQMAIYLKIEWYDSAADIETKRKLVRTAIEIQRYAGTVKAVREQVETIYKKARIEEWFSYGGTPGFWKLYVDITDDQETYHTAAEMEKLLDTLTGANATLLAYANKKIEELDTRRQTISKAIAELSVETISPQQIKKLSYYLDNWDSIDFDDKRKAADGLISTIKATSDRVQIEWKI